MVAIRIFLAVLFGLPFGSFGTVLVSRVPEGESIMRPRSSCPRCGAPIGVRDNVPVLSWLVLRGRCRRCGEPISPMYPLVEMATAALAVGAVLRYDRILPAGMVAFLLWVVLVVGVIDIRHGKIPNRIVYPAAVAFAVAIVVGDMAGWGTSVATAGIGALAYGGGLLVVALVSPRGMGMGDVKLGFLIGLVLGSPGLRYVAVAAGAAILAGGVGAIAALLAGRGRKSRIPFGPFMALGAIVSAFLGPQISAAYLRLFGA